VTALAFARWRVIPGRLGSDDRPRDPACAVIGLADLDDDERAQIVAAVGRGSDLAFTVDDLYAPDFGERGGDHAWIAVATEVPVEWWDVLDGAVPRYRVFLHSADCGLVFVGRTTEVAAQAIQFGSAWEPADWPDGPRLADAHEAAAVAHPESNLAAFYPFGR
jgi:hypothetical protein